MKKQILWLMALILGMSLNAQTVSFEHNDSRSFQDNSNYAQMTLSSMSVPHSINTSSSNSDWAKANLENYEGLLPEGFDNYVQLMRRYNCAWWFAAFFDWFTLEFTTPAYTQYQYTLRFQLSVNQEKKYSNVRAALFNYGTDSVKWSSRAQTPNGAGSFYTSNNSFSWSENKPGEACAARLDRNIGNGIDMVTNTCMIPFIFTNNGTTTTEKCYFGFSSSRCLENKNANYYHNTYLKACYTAEFVGYVKHIVYHPNATSISGTQSEDIVDAGVIGENTFKRPGYSFLSWNTKADGSGTTYKAGDLIFVDEATKGEMVLYAQWKMGGIGDSMGFEEMQDAESKVQAVKYLRDGALYIKRAGRTYNVHGMLVK